MGASLAAIALFICLFLPLDPEESEDGPRDIHHATVEPNHATVEPQAETKNGHVNPAPADACAVSVPRSCSSRMRLLSVLTAFVFTVLITLKARNYMWPQAHTHTHTHTLTKYEHTQTHALFSTKSLLHAGAASEHPYHTGRGGNGEVTVDVGRNAFIVH
jgi:hypothetical protein